MGSEALIIISDDEEDACVKPLKQKKRSLQIEEDVDVILIEEESSELVKERDVSTDDDCCIINYDPEDMRVPENQLNEGDDLVVIGERGPVACRDYPHARHLCLKFPFKTTSHETHCDQCHCYVCDVLAPCLLWGQGKQKTDHCHAFDKDETWNKMRNHARSPPAKLSAKIVIRPRVTQSPPYFPNYQHRYHSPSDICASNVNAVPDHTTSRIHVAPGSQTSVLRPTSDFVRARASRIHLRISSHISQPSLHRGTNIHTNTHVSDVGLEDLVSRDATLPRHTSNSAFRSSNGVIFQNVFGADVSRRVQEQPAVHRLNAIDSGSAQMGEVNSSVRSAVESLKRPYSFSEHIETKESVEMPHSGRTNEMILPNNDGATPIEIGKTLHTSSTNTGNLEIPDFFDVGILEEIFGNEEFENLWEDIA